MTENVYVIKVKTKPPLSSLYPSERRYSASTVGGLSLVHFGLGALSLLLGTLALSLQGPILSVACMVPSVTGLLAWRRWYIDRNIGIFFYSSLFSLVAAVLCFVVTIFNVAAISGTTGGSLWPLEKILDAPRYSLHPADGFVNDTIRGVDGVVALPKIPLNVTGNRDLSNISRTSKSLVTFEPRTIELNVSDFHSDVRNNGDYDDLKAEASFTLEERTMTSGEILQGEGATNVTRGILARERTKTFWHNPHYENSSHTRILLTLNILVASFLEAFWSLLSARIAFRGMTNCLPENDNALVASKKTRRLQKRKPPAPKPDILNHDHRRLSESLQNFTSLGLAAGGLPRLPLPESSREFRERVERFLANQATHRVVEGA